MCCGTNAGGKLESGEAGLSGIEDLWLRLVVVGMLTGADVPRLRPTEGQANIGMVTLNIHFLQHSLRVNLQ